MDLQEQKVCLSKITLTMKDSSQFSISPTLSSLLLPLYTLNEQPLTNSSLNKIRFFVS